MCSSRVFGELRIACRVAVLLLLAGVAGCAGWRVPRIDPSGRSLFIWPDEPPLGTIVGPPVASTGPTSSPFPPAGVLGPPLDAGPSTLPAQTNVDTSGSAPPATVQGPPLWPDPHAGALFPNGFPGSGCGPSLPPSTLGVSPLTASADSPVDRVQITPGNVIAPVGSEVILRGAICADSGFLVTGRPLEWLLDTSGVGQIVGVGHATFLQAHHGPRKIDNHYALGRTSNHQSVLDRGTPQTDDDVVIQQGESWVSITSSVEGASRMTAVAKEVESWPTRRSTATVHWVDAQWVFPRSSVNPVGQSHQLATQVTRLTDGRPLAGYTVRYEVLDGDLAGFAPDGSQIAEVLSNGQGLAGVELFPTQRAAATARIRVQVIRPAMGGLISSPRLRLASTTITKTWTAPDLVVQTTGPSQATVGADVSYRITVTNQGQLPANGVSVSARLPGALSLVASNPPPQNTGGDLVWSFETVEPGGTRTILLDLRAEQAGLHQVCATMQSAEGQAAESCAQTDVIATAARLAIQIDGPPTATVGETIEYKVTVANRGSALARNLEISVDFDRGLSHAQDTQGFQRIERSFGELRPGEARDVYIAFDVEAEGLLCHEVQVTGENNLRVVENACVQASRPVELAAPAFEVSKIAPQRAEVGEEHLFKIVIENTGDLPLNDIRIEEQFDDAFEPQLATEGALRINSTTLEWILETLGPGERKVYEIEYRMMRATEGGRNAQSMTTVTANGQVRADQSEVEILPRAIPPENDQNDAVEPGDGPDIHLEVAKLADPVRTGARTTFQVFVSNQGRASAFDVALQVSFSAELSPDVAVINRSMATRNIQAAVEGQTLRFSAIREMLPGDRVNFTLPFDALREGTARVDFSVTSGDLTEPLALPSESVTVLPR